MRKVYQEMSFRAAEAIAEAGGIPTGEALEELARFPHLDDEDRGVWSSLTPVQANIKESQRSFTRYQTIYAIGATFPLEGEEEPDDWERIQSQVDRVVHGLNMIPARPCSNGKLDGYKATTATYANPDPEEIQVVLMVEVFYTVNATGLE